MKPLVVLTTIPSDSHNWNLIFMELLLEEIGFEVKNLGACVPYDLLLKSCYKYSPDIIVVSTVNGHGFIEGKLLVEYLQDYLIQSEVPIYIGGKLSTDKTKSLTYALELERAGFTKAYAKDEDLIKFKQKLKEKIEVFNNAETVMIQ